MSDIKYKDYILEAIDQLRRRKARPDVHRICNFLMRKFAISYVDAKRDLQKCVDQEVVLRVEYKGNISYRNAAKKFLQIKREGDSSPNGTKPNRKFVGLLTNGIAELIVQEPDYLEVGVPGPELIRNILSKDNVRYTKKYVNILLDKEVESGGLIKMENGNYLVGPVRPEESLNKDKAIIETIVVKCEPDVPPLIYRKQLLPDIKQGVKKEKMENKHSDETTIYPSNENGNLRVGSRRKRAKKVFDPSDNNLPKRRGRPMGSLNKSTIEKQIHKYPDTDSRPESRSSITSSREQGGVCSVCHNNKRVPNDRFVTCRECSNKAHVNCLNGDDMMLKMYPDNTWQCPYCKTCCICYETSDAGYLTVCSVCADAYHSACHDPPILEKTKGTTKWLCINCQMPDQLQISEIHPNVSRGDIVFTHKSIIEDGESNQDSQSCNVVMSTSDDSNHNSLPPSPTPPTLSPQPNHLCSIASPETRCALPDSINIKEEADIEDLIDPSIPDASNWTSDDVYNYFVQYFPEEAKVFKEQEIDGCSLLLMKRMDVLTGLKLKLGPALKIYRHIVKLQFRRDDPKLYWL